MDILGWLTNHWLEAVIWHLIIGHLVIGLLLVIDWPLPMLVIETSKSFIWTFWSGVVFWPVILLFLAFCMLIRWRREQKLANSLGAEHVGWWP